MPPSLQGTHGGHHRGRDQTDWTQQHWRLGFLWECTVCLKLLSNWLNPEALKIINHMKVPFGCNLLEGPSLPSSIVKEGSAWGGCECPEEKKSTPKHIDASDLGATVLTAGWSSLPAMTTLLASDIPVGCTLQSHSFTFSSSGKLFYIEFTNYQTWRILSDWCPVTCIPIPQHQ